MLSIAIAAALSAPSPALDEPVRPDRQARAVVRIVRAETIRLGQNGGTKSEGAVLRETVLPTQDGSMKRSALVEFY